MELCRNYYLTIANKSGIAEAHKNALQLTAHMYTLRRINSIIKHVKQ